MIEIVLLNTPTVFVANRNMVNISGNVKGVSSNPAARDIKVFKSGTSQLEIETVSDGITGDYSCLIEGSPDKSYRVEAFADENTDDENSQILDFVNPIQNTTIV